MRFNEPKRESVARSTHRRGITEYQGDSPTHALIHLSLDKSFYLMRKRQRKKNEKKLKLFVDDITSWRAFLYGSQKVDPNLIHFFKSLSCEEKQKYLDDLRNKIQENIRQMGIPRLNIE